MFKKAVCLIMTVFSFGSAVVYGSTITTISTESVSEVVAPTVEAESVIIVDIKTGQQLYGKNIYEKQYPASITKIMTCMLALENLDLNGQITFSETAVDIEIGSSAAYAVEGEVVGTKDCVYGLMIHSCNDFANGLAEAVSGTQEAFATLMTDTAKELGCTNTNFVNAHGLDDEKHYTCAYDMALIGKYAYENYPTYKDIIAQQRYQVEPTNKCEETRYWKNGNELILEDGWYYYEPCLGGKTGYTEIAKYTLVSYADINGRELICVMLKAPSKAVAMEETKALYEYIRENVSVEYYAELDKAYEEAHKDDESSQTDTDNNEQSSSSAEDVKEANASASKEENAGKKDNIFLKIIVFLLKLVAVVLVGFAVFVVVFYCYLRYKIYLKKKRRAESQRRREIAKKRQAEARYRQNLENRQNKKEQL